MELKKDERIDDLEIKGLKIIQNKNGFCFGIDSVLLSDFAKNIKKNARVIDLGTGTGIISILLSAKTTDSEFVGIEVQKEVADMAERSVKLNNLERRIKILNENILNLENIFKPKSFDVIVTNPPYKKINSGFLNEENKKAISRHETTAKLEDFIHISSYLLKDFGEFYMIHRPDRLVDIFSIMRNEKIEPKLIRFIYPNKNKNSNMILIKGVKNGKPFLKIEKDLFVYNEDGTYSDEIFEIYNKKRRK